MTETVVNLGISGLLFIFGAGIKYGKAYNLIAGYNTATDQEKKYMAEKGLGDYIGRQLMIMAAAPALGLLLAKAGFIWGTEIGIGLVVILTLYTVAGARRYNPPPSADPESAGKSRRQARISIAALCFTLLVFAGAGINIAGTSRNAKFTLDEKQLIIGGSYGTTISYSDIEKLELSSEFPIIGYKNNGFNWGAILKGNFNIEGLGPALLFLHSDQAPVIYIYRTGGPPVLINFADAKQTISLYEQLQDKKNRH